MSAEAKKAIDALALPRWPSHFRALRATNTAFKPAHCAVNPEINEKIALWRGDITQLKIDGIVNAANQDLWAGGGICGAIHKAAGPRLAQACKKIGHCPTGDTVITQGFKLPSKYVLHSVGPTNRSPVALQSCYRTILDLCVKHQVRSVCMCCISTGIFEAACMIALSTVREFLENPEHRKAIDLVVFCTFLIEDVRLYDAYAAAFFPVEPPVEEPAEEQPMDSSEEKMATVQPVIGGEEPAAKATEEKKPMEQQPAATQLPPTQANQPPLNEVPMNEVPQSAPESVRLVVPESGGAPSAAAGQSMEQAPIASSAVDQSSEPAPMERSSSDYFTPEVQSSNIGPSPIVEQQPSAQSSIADQSIAVDMQTPMCLLLNQSSTTQLPSPKGSEERPVGPQGGDGKAEAK